jgi:hypothetical protein
MRDRTDRWKWPFALGMAALLTCGLFLLVPAGWLDGLLPGSRGDRELGRDRRDRWLVLTPPPEIEAVDSPLFPPPARVARTVPDHRDPRWWEQGWRVQTVAAVSRDLGQAPAPGDSVTLLLAALGVGEDFLSQARPDSVLASRLALLQVEDSLRFDELKPYLSAMTRSRAYADILSRAADMYDDHLQAQVMVPD